MNHFLTIFLFALCMEFQGQAQASHTKTEPLFMLDGNRTIYSVMQTLNPPDIAAIEVIKDSTAMLRFGDEARNGVIAVTTKKHARE